MRGLVCVSSLCYTRGFFPFQSRKPLIPTPPSTFPCRRDTSVNFSLGDQWTPFVDPTCGVWWSPRHSPLSNLLNYSFLRLTCVLHGIRSLVTAPKALSLHRGDLSSQWTPEKVRSYFPSTPKVGDSSDFSEWTKYGGDRRVRRPTFLWFTTRRWYSSLLILKASEGSTNSSIHTCPSFPQSW